MLIIVVGTWPCLTNFFVYMTALIFILKKMAYSESVFVHLNFGLYISIINTLITGNYLLYHYHVGDVDHVIYV